MLRHKEDQDADIVPCSRMLENLVERCGCAVRHKFPTARRDVRRMAFGVPSACHILRIPLLLLVELVYRLHSRISWNAVGYASCSRSSGSSIFKIS